MWQAGRVREHEREAHNLAMAGHPAILARYDWLPKLPLVVRLNLVRKDGRLQQDFIALAKAAIDQVGPVAAVAPLARQLLADIENQPTRTRLAAMADAEIVALAAPYVRVLLELVRGVAPGRTRAELGAVALNGDLLDALGPQGLVRHVLIRPVLLEDRVKAVLLILAATAGVDELGEREFPPLNQNSSERKLIESVLCALSGTNADPSGAGEVATPTFHNSAVTEARFPGLPSNHIVRVNAATMTRLATDALLTVMTLASTRALTVCTHSWINREQLILEAAPHPGKWVVTLCNHATTHECQPHPGGWVLRNASHLLDAILVVASSHSPGTNPRYLFEGQPQLVSRDWLDLCDRELAGDPSAVQGATLHSLIDQVSDITAACLCSAAAGFVRKANGKQFAPSNTDKTRKTQRAVTGTEWKTLEKRSKLLQFCKDNDISGCPTWNADLGLCNFRPT